MDDPLIGLTIFDSRRNPSSSGPGRPLSVSTTNGSAKHSARRSESVDSNKLREEEKERNKGSRDVDKEKKTDSKNGSKKENAKTSRTSGGGKLNSKEGHSGKKTNAGGKGKPTRGSEISGDLDKCFPCLPGLEDPLEREKDDEVSGPSSEASTPPSPLPEGEDNVDSAEETTQAIDTHPLTPGVVDSNILMNSPVPQPQNFWLMRLFQSKLFDMSIAIGYLFNSKDSDVQAYLGNKLFVSIQ